MARLAGMGVVEGDPPALQAVPFWYPKASGRARALVVELEAVGNRHFLPYSPRRSCVGGSSIG